MKRIYCFIFILLCVFVSPLTAKAQCDDQRMAELNKIAGNVQVSYNYELDETGEPSFTVYLTNVTPDIYVVDMFGNEYREFENIVSPDALYLYVHSNDPNCGDELSRITVKLPNYNTYSKLSECVGNTNLLCNIWQDTSEYSEDVFKNLLKTNNTVSNKITEDKEENGFDITPIIITTVVIIAVVIIVYFLINKLIRRSS